MAGKKRYVGTLLLDIILKLINLLEGIYKVQNIEILFHMMIVAQLYVGCLKYTAIQRNYDFSSENFTYVSLVCTQSSIDSDLIFLKNT